MCYFKMILWEICELFATVCNIGANVFMMVCMMQNAYQRVPIRVIYMQICGNAAWISSASLRNDPFLLSTASSSLFVQMTTAYLIRQAVSRDVVKLTDSNDELPQMPFVNLEASCDVISTKTRTTRK